MRPPRKLTRDEWRHAFDRCMICQMPVFGDVHEIARGPFRQAALEEPAAWLYVCRTCHEGKLAAMPIADQLAIKLIHDPLHYDRVTVSILRGRAAEAVSAADVEEALISHFGRWPQPVWPAWYKLQLEGIEDDGATP